MSNNSASNPSYKNQISRLNRISGQVEGIKKMIEENRYCPDILTQTKAIRSAIKSLETTILDSHLNCCVRNAFASDSKSEQEKKIEELKNLFYRHA